MYGFLWLLLLHIHDNGKLRYEAGWGKKLSFVFAMASNGLSDVTPRYTQDFDSLTERRLGVHEVSLAKVPDMLCNFNGQDILIIYAR